MAMKLKMDENGSAVLQDGKPVYVYDDGKEIQVDAEQLFAKIAELNNESKGHRLKSKELEEKFAKVGDMDLDELSRLKSEVDALGGLENVRKGAKINIEEVKAEIQKAYEAKLSEKEKELSSKDAHIYKLEVSNRFTSSKFISEKLILPPDIAEATFGSNFKIEDGQVVAYLGGNKIYSRERPGEPASFEESVQVIVDAYPMKDRILRGVGASGSGASSSSNNANRSDANKKASDMNAGEKAKFIGEHGLAKWQDKVATDYKQ